MSDVTKQDVLRVIGKGLIGAGAIAAVGVGLLGLAGLAGLKQEQKGNHVRWTDANRWE